MTDPIADFLTRIRNSLAVRKTEIRMPYSRLKHSLAKLLVEAGYLRHAEKIDEGFGVLQIELAYDNEGNPLMHHSERVSTPGRRVYLGYDKLKPVCSGRGLAVVSTSQGLLSDKEAKKLKVGGEIMCKVW